jgi:hypothetical protein
VGEFRTPLGGNKPGQAVIQANNGQPWRLLAEQYSTTTGRYLPVRSHSKRENRLAGSEAILLRIPTSRDACHKRDLRTTHPIESHAAKSMIIIAACLPWRPSERSSMEEDSTWCILTSCATLSFRLLRSPSTSGFPITRSTKRMQGVQSVSPRRDECSSEIYFYGASQRIAVEENC